MFFLVLVVIDIARAKWRRTSAFNLTLPYLTLNKNTIVKVNTGVGTTEEAETGENIGQGTGEGAIISAANISDGITKAFKHSSQEISYGEEMLQPLLFQDDIARVCDTVEA